MHIIIEKDYIRISFLKPINPYLLLPKNSSHYLLKFSNNLRLLSTQILWKDKILNFCKWQHTILCLPLPSINITNTWPFLDMPFKHIAISYFYHMLIWQASISEPRSHEMKPHWLELKRRILRKYNSSSIKLNRPIIQNPPIKNFKNQIHPTSNPKAWDRKSI